MDRVLVTGCNGFVGRLLVERLVAEGYEVWGADRTGGGAFAGKTWLVGDLVDRNYVEELLDNADPTCVVHLAGQASVRKSFDDPAQTLSDNTLPAINMLNALRKYGHETRVLLVGSADEYGSVAPSQLPLTEDTPGRSESPYALAKSIQGQIGRMFARLYGIDAIMTRSFNHTGPGQRDTFALPSFARQVAAIRRGEREPVMKVGNLDVKRDFMDVRDVCEAYLALIRKGKAGETYNVCSGKSYRIGDMLDRLCELAGVKVSIEVDPDRLRPVDMPELRGDPARIAADTGWTAKISIDETLQSLLDYWDKEDA
jgi:GDP-4-dehydro-6-deoxy-D-mannose reductase